MRSRREKMAMMKLVSLGCRAHGSGFFPKVNDMSLELTSLPSLLERRHLDP